MTAKPALPVLILCLSRHDPHFQGIPRLAWAYEQQLEQSIVRAAGVRVMRISRLVLQKAAVEALADLE